MYVCGRGTDTYGTILPALCELRRRGVTLGQISISGTSSGSINPAREKIEQLNSLMGTDLALRYFPEGNAHDSESYLKALNEIPRPACAIIVVPDHLHAEIASECIKAGLHSLVVKPLAPTLEESKQLITLQEQSGIYGAVEFHKRFDRANLKLKDTIENGSIGDPLYFIVEYSQRKSIPSEKFASWVDQTNIFQYLGVHYVDIIYFATHATPKRAMAVGQYGWLKKQNINAFDAIHGTIEWEMPNSKTFLSYLFTNWIDPESTSAMSNQRIKVIGTRGRYESDQKRRGICITTDYDGIDEPNPDFCSAYPTGNGDISYQGYGIESIHTFLKDVSDLEQNRTTLKHLESCRPTFGDSLPSVAVIESVNKSLTHQGAWIDIKY